MSMVRPWRNAATVSGPVRATRADIAELNEVFSDAFTERYRRDGMVGVRVPALNPEIWQYAIDDAAEGAMLWRDERGGIAAFNMVHRSGTEAWMGPLAVRIDCQHRGLGREVVQHGIEWLRGNGATTIGLETMPRTMDNIGFYSRLGLVPGHMTITLALDSASVKTSLINLSALAPADQDETIAQIGALVTAVTPGADYTREIRLTQELGLGDTHLLHRSGELVGWALTHIEPLVEGRGREELRVLKLVARDDADFEVLAEGLSGTARQFGAKRVSFRVQGAYPAAFRTLVAMRAHVRWTDLRMTLSGYPDRPSAQGVALSNWEI